ncbi:MAG: hypothetical protein PVH12_00455 [Candidatus Bathyarchaeota archaeon]
MPPPFPVITSNSTLCLLCARAQSSHNLGIKLKEMPWDITGTTMWVPDGRCDMRDVGLIARLFGSMEGDGNYDDRADIAGPTNGPDGKIDMRDVGLVARHFGETL